MELEVNSSRAPATDTRSRVARWIIKHDDFCATLVILTVLTINCLATIWRSIHEPTTIAFVVFCNVDIGLLHWCLNQLEGASARRKEVLKVSIWVLTTLLTVAFCHRVAGMMPPVITGIVWAMGAVSIFGISYALFVYDDARPATDGKASLKPPC